MISFEVNVIGATSIVGHYAVMQLKDSGYSVAAYSRAIQSAYT